MCAVHASFSFRHAAKGPSWNRTRAGDTPLSQYLTLSYLFKLISLIWHIINRNQYGVFSELIPIISNKGDRYLEQMNIFTENKNLSVKV